MRDSDWPYIAKTWILGTTKGPVQGARMSKRVNALRARGAWFLVACDPTNLDLILGWMAGERIWIDNDLDGFRPEVLHYLYTKRQYRRQGVARSLLAVSDLASNTHILCTHWSSDIEPLKSKLCLFPILP